MSDSKKSAFCLIVVSLVIIGLVGYLLYKSYKEKYEFNAKIGMEGPFVSLLGGFGTPVHNFNDVPQLTYLQHEAQSNQYTNDEIANMYLDSAHRSKINNMM